MRELSLEETKKIQLDILDAVDQFCKSNGLHYSLAFGTLLGAVRHGGYIPWDDDIDLAMPREDYEKFKETFNVPNYRVLSPNNPKEYLHPFLKVENSMTFQEEDIAMNCEIGVNIDIFPVDNCPIEGKELQNWIKNKKFLYRLIILKTRSLSKNRSWWKNSIILLGKCMISPIPAARITSLLDRIAQTFRYKDVPGVALWDKVFPKKFFEEYTTIDFEGKPYATLKNYDTYLTHQFGDYMQLPPVEQRKTHHEWKAFLKD